MSDQPDLFHEATSDTGLPQCTCGAWARIWAAAHQAWTERRQGESLGDWMQRHAARTGHTRDCAINQWTRAGLPSCSLCGAPECDCAR